MSSNQPHIERAYHLYNNLSFYKTDFICNGIDKFLSFYFENNKSAYIVFYYLYAAITKTSYKFTENSIEIDLPEQYKDLNFDDKVDDILISCKNSKLTLTSDSKENLTRLVSKNLQYLLEFVPKTLNSGNTVDTIDSTPLGSLEEKERPDDILRKIFHFAENYPPYKKIFQNWYSEGIENISYKIFNEFALSFTCAEYLRSSTFTVKLRDFEGSQSGDKWDSENNDTIPQLIHTINVMVMHYQLFCRRVQAQILRKPNELYFCSQRNIENELKATLPVLGLGKFKKDNSSIIAELFAAIIEIGYIDHRFVLDQQTIERLVFALERIKSSGEKYLGIESWKLDKADIDNLKNLERNARSRKNTTKIILKLVYAKACTLLGKIDSFLKKSSSYNKVPYPKIKIIDRFHIKSREEIAEKYSEIIDTVRDVENGPLEKIPEDDRNDDIDRYDRQVYHIRENYIWFKEKEGQSRDYQSLTSDNVSSFYDEYVERKTDRLPDDIIFFSDKFLESALIVVGKDIKVQLDQIAEKNNDASDRITKVYQTIKFFRELNEELKKLAEFSEKFGLMKDQHLFCNSFYAPDITNDGKSNRVKYERQIFDRDKYKLKESIDNSWLFMASTHYPPAYPNHYKRLYEEFDLQRKELSARLYMELPNFLNRNIKQDIGEEHNRVVEIMDGERHKNDEIRSKEHENIISVLSKERNNTIQIMAIFAAMMAFVTASVGAIKMFETWQGFGQFALIFVSSLLAFVLILRLFISANLKLTFYVVVLVLCALGMYFAQDSLVRLVLGVGMFWVVMFNCKRCK